MEFVTDRALHYERSRRRFAAGDELRLDELYRLAHLPLLDPGHPDVIARRDGSDYERGHYERTRRSLVVPVDPADLEASPTFRAVDAALRASSFTAKMAWRVMRQRKDKLHATLGSGIAAERVPAIVAGVRAVMGEIGDFALRLGAPMVGDRNFGRIYLPVYPEQRGGEDVLARLQEVAGLQRTGLYLVGYYSLADHLTAAETAELDAILTAHEGATLATIQVHRLWLMQTHDDLALSARVLHEIGGGADAHLLPRQERLARGIRGE